MKALDFLSVDYLSDGLSSREAVTRLEKEHKNDKKGRKKSLLVLGHEGSERAGMVYITEEFQKLLPEIEFKYIECGEVYSYTR